MSVARLRIMLVEDNERLRRIIARSLASLGCEVTEAADARETLQLIESGVPCDLLLSDLRMPGDIDGVELANRVAGIRPGIKVLLQTGFYENLSVPYPLLQKPYSLDELLAAIESATATSC